MRDIIQILANLVGIASGLAALYVICAPLLQAPPPAVLYALA